MRWNIRHLALPAAVLSLLWGGVAAAKEQPAQPVGKRPPVLTLPREAGKGPGRETKVLYEGEGLKLVLLTLRQGTVLPLHSASSPVTLQVLAGTGSLRFEGQEVRAEPGVLVPLAAGVPHEVRPSSGGDMVLLVTYATRASAPTGAEPPHAH